MLITYLLWLKSFAISTHDILVNHNLCFCSNQSPEFGINLNVLNISTSLGLILMWVLNKKLNGKLFRAIYHFFKCKPTVGGFLLSVVKTIVFMLALPFAYLALYRIIVLGIVWVIAVCQVFLLAFFGILAFLYMLSSGVPEKSIPLLILMIAVIVLIFTCMVDHKK